MDGVSAQVWTTTEASMGNKEDETGDRADPALAGDHPRLGTIRTNFGIECLFRPRNAHKCLSGVR
jgi:hypothetical protein